MEVFLTGIRRVGWMFEKVERDKEQRRLSKPLKKLEGRRRRRGGLRFRRKLNDYG